MDIERNPVPGSTMKRRLACVDVDDQGNKIGAECSKKYFGIGKGAKFSCKNKCVSGSFLYPRRWARSGDYFHFHQGIDLGAPTGSKIISVTGGIVVARKDWDGTSAGYGNGVGIWDPETQRSYWYAHCTQVLVNIGDPVSQEMEIATVGNTGKAGKPHLHFEILDVKLGKGGPTGGKDWERVLGEPKGSSPRIDPLQGLAELGPWGMKQLNFPSGTKVSDDEAEALHKVVEGVNVGGQYPMGANNLWHGGVHLAAGDGAVLCAPVSGRIVAARLDPDPEYASVSKGFGSTNFVLLEHEISEYVYNKMQKNSGGGAGGGGGSKPKSKSKPTVGAGGTNPPSKVSEAKARLHEATDDDGTPFYDPADLHDLEDGDLVEDEFIEAIRAFQESIGSPYSSKSKPWPDGLMTVPGYTWDKLVEAAPDKNDDPDDPGGENDQPVPPPPKDPKRLVYSLFMHVGAEPITDELAEKVPWLTRVRLTPDEHDEDEKKAEETRKQLEAEHAEDQEEADSHELSGSVTQGVGSHDDVEWVQKRLKRFGYYAGPVNGDADSLGLLEAIKAFQSAECGSKSPDGVVSAKKSKSAKTPTLNHLKQTKRELGLDPDDPSGASVRNVDPVFRKRAASRNDKDVAKVMTDLNVEVVSGEALWTAARARGFNADGTTAIRDQVHWEMFSEQALLSEWKKIEDPDQDARVPDELVAQVETEEGGEGSPFRKDGIISVPEIMFFYQSGKAAPLRQAQCKFRSEWGLDVAKYLDGISEGEYAWVTDGQKEEVERYQFWDEAKGAVPSDPGVWHYNPIEFVAEYQRCLYVPSVKHDPTLPSEIGTLVVNVLYADDTPYEGATVHVTPNGHPERQQQTSDEGSAVFSGVPVGLVTVTVEGSIVGPVAALVPNDHAEIVEYRTELPTPAMPPGKLTVIVRKHTKVVDKGVKVALLRDGVLAGSGVTNGSGKVVFSDLQPGKYELGYGDAKDMVEVTIKKKKSQTLTVYQPGPPEPTTGDIRASVKHGSSGVAEELVVVLDEGGNFIAGNKTNDKGVVLFENLEPKSYLVAAGSASKNVKLKAGKLEKVSMSI